VAFTHDTEMSLLAAVTLVNTAEEPDTMTTVTELDQWYAEFSYTGSRQPGNAELAAVRALRPELRRLFTSDRDTAAGIVNRMLAEAQALPRLVRHEPFDWHLHAVPSDASLATRISVEVAMAMVDMIRADEMSRLAICADADCDGIVLDLSRNRSRRYCSTTCGNRNSVAAYRARRTVADR
jgi:predicted RNA-binding Zn ribbon-like protein